MSVPFRLLIDECLASHKLIGLLRKAGHDTISARDAPGAGASDDEVLAYARRDRRCVITENCADFRLLHELNGQHDGLILVYQDADARDMNTNDIVLALERVRERYPTSIANELIILNHFRR